MRCFRSCPTTTSRCRPAFMRTFRRSPTPPRCPSSCTTFPPGPSASCPTTRWRGSPKSKQFIGLRDGTGDITASDAPAVAAAARVSAAVRRRRNGAGFHRQWRRWLHLHDIECRAGAVPGDLLELQAGTTADRAIPAEPAGAADGRAFQREPGCPEICAVPARLHVARPPACRSSNWPMPAKAEVASAIAGIGDEDLACPIESWHGPAPAALARLTRPLRCRGVSNELKRSRNGMARQDAARLAAGDSALCRDLGQCRQIGGDGNRKRDRQAWPAARRQTGFQLFS